MRDTETLSSYGSDRWPLTVKRELTGGRLPRPGIVIRPRNADEVAVVLHRCQALALPVTPYGAGSSVVGGAVPTDGGVVVDMSRMDAIGELDETSLLVTVEAGVRGHALEEWLNQRGYTLGHYPQSLHISTVGGWVATRASGTFSSGYGNIEDLVDGLRVVLPTGDLLVIAPNPRKSAGPDLAELFLGSEGTLGVVTEVDLRVRRLPSEVRFSGYTFSSLDDGVDVIRELAQGSMPPSVVRLYDPAEAVRLLAEVSVAPGSSLLVLGWDGDPEYIDVQERVADTLVPHHAGRRIGSAVGEAWFASRFDVSALVAGTERSGGMADTIEISMLWKDATAVYDAAVAAVTPHVDRVVAHFSHVYRSGTSLYVIFFIEADSDEEAERRYSDAWSALTEAALAAGASVSHHHGVGVARARWMAQQHGRGWVVLQGIKRLLDPAGVLNPGKLITSDA